MLLFWVLEVLVIVERLKSTKELECIRQQLKKLTPKAFPCPKSDLLTLVLYMLIKNSIYRRAPGRPRDV